MTRLFHSSLAAMAGTALLVTGCATASVSRKAAGLPTPLPPLGSMGGVTY